MSSEVVIFVENGRRRKGERANCLECSSVFVRRLSLSNGPKKYCSRSCAAKASIVFLKKTPCGVCKKTIEVRSQRFKQCKSGVFFCSGACQAIAQQIEGGIKEIHPSHYGNGKGSYKSRAFKKYRAECVDCGLSFRPFLVVHHKDGDRENNHSRNLEVVCLNHHAMRHMKQLKCGRWVYSTRCLTPRRLLKKIRLLIETGE